MKNIKHIICTFLSVFIVFLILFFTVSSCHKSNCSNEQNNTDVYNEDKEKDFIKYAEFNVCYDALEKAMLADIESHTNNDNIKINWIEPLSYLGAKYGGDFKQYKSNDLTEITDRLKSGEKINDITKDMKYYSYYNQVYSAVLGGFLGEFSEEKTDENGKIIKEKKYGLKVFSPIAKTFPFSHFDDFGASRDYGYKRNHLGHDLMAATGTPVIAIESGTVEIMGWNQYGGWRIGIRSNDKKRYYYYAHLRQNRPFHPDIKEGGTVKAGDVIGYVGRTGYSANENVNGIETSHLHLGMELVFDESQKECDNEIWIDMYAVTKLLLKHQSAVYRVDETKEFYRKYNFEE